jgi:hypothetical protein
MSWWALPIELFAVWFLWLLAAATERAVADAQRGIPDGQRGGVSAGFLLFAPLFFWGVATLIDLAGGSWGTRVVGSIHAALGVVFLASFLRDLWRLRLLDGPSRG